MPSIADEKYVRLTTFTKDGRRKESPVWIADLGDGTVGFTTGLESWKVKRINATPAVELAPSNMKGVVAEGAATVTGSATVATGAASAPVEGAIKAKYGFQVSAMKAMSKVGKLFGRGEAANCSVVITLD
ncbi:MAG: PPOX class F420-dependent oxidoreductase [Acidimicrobiales bacterium]